MQSIQTIIIRERTEKILGRYNPENDTIPGAPSVTWTDQQLMECIDRLVIVVEDLQDQIQALDEKIERTRP